jgi:hypothetical protein
MVKIRKALKIVENFTEREETDRDSDVRIYGINFRSVGRENVNRTEMH